MAGSAACTTRPITSTAGLASALSCTVVSSVSSRHSAWRCCAPGPEVMRIQSELHNTVLMITHDVDEAVLLCDRIVMMTNGPAATIGQVLTVDLPRPRDRIALADDPRYNHCRHEVLSFLHEKQRKVEPLHARATRAEARAERSAA